MSKRTGVEDLSSATKRSKAEDNSENVADDDNEMEEDDSTENESEMADDDSIENDNDDNDDDSSTTISDAFKKGSHSLSGPPTLAQLALKGAWIAEIDSADLEKCKELKSELDELAAKTKKRIRKLEQEETDRGLSYKGPDAVTCQCGNSFQSGGEYGASCSCVDNEEEEKEKCIKCISSCGNCGHFLCKECGEHCSSCQELFCPPGGGCLEDYGGLMCKGCTESQWGWSGPS